MSRAQSRFALGIRVLVAMATALFALMPPFEATAQADAPGAAASKPQSTPPATWKPPTESWVGQLQAVGEWVAKQGTCDVHCFTIDRMRISGDVSGALAFEIRGDVLANERVAIPLFGPPSNVRIDSVTDGGKPAIVGFEGDHYFVYTSARHFVVRGTFTLDRDQAITVPGPINALEADLAKGRVVEGA